LKRPLLNFIGLLLFCTGLSCFDTVARAQYILASPDTTLNSDGWALASGNMSGFLGAITSSSNFGPTGIDHQSLSVVQLSSVTSGTLAGVNGLIVPWWNNSQASPSQTAILNAFHSGTDLWLLEDDSSHNSLGTALGISSTNATNAFSNGSAPLFSGLFGTAVNTTVSGNFDQFTNIPALGGTIAGVNTNGEVTVAYWARGAFAPGSGALVIFGDVDTISNFTATYGVTPNAGGILALNTTAWLLNGAQAIPEPSTCALLGLGGLLLLARRWRAARAAR